MEGWPDILERWNDKLNPILVKEVRQIVRSPGYLGAWLGLIFLLWSATCIILWMWGQPLAATNSGGKVFGVLFGLFAAGLCTVVPVRAFLSAESEQQEHVLETLSVTGITPFRIVWGKLIASSVGASLLYATVTPFLCMCYLFNGIGVVEIALALLASAMACFVAAVLGIAVGASVKDSIWHAPSLVLVIAFGLFVWFVLMSFVIQLLAGRHVEAMGWLFCAGYAGLFHCLTMTAVANDKFTVRYARPRPKPSLRDNDSCTTR